MIKIAKLFDESISSSIGCTEPAAISLAVSVALNAVMGRLPEDYANKGLDLPPRTIKERIKWITVRASRDVFKNASHVSVSHEYDLKGVGYAAALGVFCQPARNLELFDGLTEEKALEASDLLKAGKVTVVPEYGWDELRIEAEVVTEDGTGTAHIVGEHSNIAYIEVDGKPKFQKVEIEDEADELMSLQRLRDFIRVIEEDLSGEVNGRSAKWVVLGFLPNKK